MERLSMFFGIAIVLFFVVLGAMVGARIDQTTIALLGGTVIGLAIAIPCTALVTYIVFKARAESSSHAHHSQPPQQWIMPPNYPTAQTPTHHTAVSPTSQPYSEPFVLPPQRRFYIIGENGEASEITSDSDET